MFQNLDLFQQSAAMARHAGRAQSQIARNVANADTPGYQARYLAAFDPEDRSTLLQVKRAGHLAPEGGDAQLVTARDATSPNGNSVSLESEIFAAIEAQRSHSNALAIYRHALTLIRTAVKG